MNIAETVLNRYKDLDLPSDWEDSIKNGLIGFDPKIIEQKEDPYQYLHEQDDKLLCLLYALYKCESFIENGKRLGIEYDILHETLKELGRHARNYNRSHSGEKVGLYQIKWIGKILEGKIYCLGRLEFERAVTQKTWEDHGIFPGDKVLSVHIPRTNGPLSEDLFEDSFRQSTAFFAKYFPDFNYKAYVCNSWLLDPTLKTLLPQGSNIIKFQNKFDIVQKTESESGIRIAFDSKATYENVTEYPPKTSLQKAMIEHVKKGGRLYSGYGIMKR